MSTVQKPALPALHWGFVATGATSSSFVQDLVRPSDSGGPIHDGVGRCVAGSSYGPVIVYQ